MEMEYNRHMLVLEHHDVVHGGRAGWVPFVDLLRSMPFGRMRVLSEYMSLAQHPKTW